MIILDGAIRFNKLVYPPDTTMRTHREFTAFSEADQRYRQTGFKKLFLSHKTGDSEAEDLAKRLARRFNIAVYMAEWDTNVTNDSPSLPSYIKRKIKTSNGFLVYANPQIAVSMWVGYEIDIADASSLPSARVTRSTYDRTLPTVILALHKLSSDLEIDNWVRKHVRR